VGGPLLIYDPNVTSSFRDLQRPSFPLFSPCNFDLSNVDHDDDVMALDEFDPTLKMDSFIVPSKPTIQRKNYDAFRKFQYSWATKLPWEKFYLGSNGNLHTIKCKIYNEVGGKDKYLLLNGIHFVTMQVEGKLKGTLDQCDEGGLVPF
jgi:hypothetical protein